MGQTVMNTTLAANNALLVSFCNQFISPEYSLAVVNPTDGSCCWIDLGADEQVLSGLQGVTGVTGDQTRLFIFTQGQSPALISFCKETLRVLFVKPLARIKDPHSAVLLGGILYTVSTGTNQIFSIDVSGTSPGEETLYWSYPDTDATCDVVHLNGLAWVEDRFLATCFGSRDNDGKWGNNGRLFFIDSNETILENLSNPHTPYQHNDTIYVAESKSGIVHRLSRSDDNQWQTSAPIVIGGYVRGLYILCNHLYIGVSAERSFSRSMGHAVPHSKSASRGRLIQVCLSDLSTCEVNGFAFLGDEVYDLTATPSDLATRLISNTDASIDRLGSVKQRVQRLIHQKEFLEQQCEANRKSLDHVMLLSQQDKHEIEHLHLQIKYQKHDIENYRIAIDQVLESTSWKITQPLRALSGFVKLTARRLRLIKRLPDLLRAIDRNRLNSFIYYFIKGDFRAISSKIRLLLSDIESIEFRAYIQSGDGLNLCVMTTRHTEYVAHNMAAILQKHGHNVDIFFKEPEKFNHDFYFVLCPQMFRSLPPGQKRVAFQFEQSVSDRWFTQDYIDTLCHCFAVFDYSQKNISFLAENQCAYPHIYYLPIGATSRWMNEYISEKKHQVIFYGDYKSSPRRRMMLDALSVHFDVELIDNLFGEPLRQKIREASIVINLHYYEDALLETTRIQECLSLGARVVSESSPDVSDYPELNNVVKFFAVGDKRAMVESIKRVLDTPFSASEHWDYVLKSEHHFEFMFDRFLFSTGFLGLDAILASEPEIPAHKDFYAISLPETQHRRQFILSELPENSYLFDGVRFSPGWLGCALSYIKLFQAAQKHQMPRVTIMEDDVVLPENFAEQYEVITEYLDRDPSSWHIFSGLIAVLHPDVRILKQEVYKGLTFVTIDRMTSMVFNIYNQSILPQLLSWDASNHDAHTNTIDKYIEGLVDLRVVVVLPFFVGHREEAHSTLWGIENTHYADLIATTEKKLLALMLESKVQASGSPETQ